MALRKTCYAYSPGSDSAGWKLPVCNDAGQVTASKVGQAIAALKNFRGNQVDLPESAVAGVKTRLRRLWRSVNPDKDAGEMPTTIKASEGETEDLDFDDGYYPYGVSRAHAKKAKANAAVSYREAGGTAEDTPERCGNCRYYGWAECGLVEGTIEAPYVCNLYEDRPVTYEPMMTMAEVTYPNGGYALFEPFTFAAPEASSAEEPASQWIDYWPAPGTFTHPKYGSIAISPERNAKIVENFSSGIYQYPIPVDCEHDSADREQRGAAGWIYDMRLGEDGRIEAEVGWTGRGQDLLADDRYKFFSPSVKLLWQDSQGGVYQDVPIGGALTTRPFFKNAHLTPLVATEDGALEFHEVPGGASGMTARPLRIVLPQRLDRSEPEPTGKGGLPVTKIDDPVVTPPAPAPQFSEDEVAFFRELQASGLSIQDFTEMKSKAERTDKLETDVKAMKEAQQRQDFTEMVRGRKGEDDGAPWAGEVEGHVSMLVHLSETAGEDSDLFKNYVARERASAQALRTSNVFSEQGTGAPATPAADTAQGQIDVWVTEKVTAGKDYNQAMNEVAQEHPAEYGRYRRETSVRI